MKNKLNIVPVYKLFEDLLLISIKKIKLQNKKKIKILDLGCGNKPYEKKIKKLLTKFNVEYVGIDFYSNEADIKLDLNNNKIPFENNYFDLIICTEVLEHLYKSLFVIGEIKRVSKFNGLILITTPFFFPIHEKKHDYFRYTYNFYEYIFSDLKIVKENISTPVDKLCLFLFKNKYITYSYYMDYGILIKNEKK